MDAARHPEQIRAPDRQAQALGHALRRCSASAALMVGVLTLRRAVRRHGDRRRAAPDVASSSPTSRRAAPAQAGILSAWVGTTLVMLVTAAAAVPLGVAAGVYLEEYAPKNWVTDVIEINITNLAGVPSIVYGLLALGLFVYQFGFGQSILSAGLTLALLILPVVIVATREAIRSIPQMIREGAYALRRHHVADGAATTSSRIPCAGILTGVIIGMARAIGETAPIITIGALTFIAFLPPAPFTGDPPVPGCSTGCSRRSP
ncbi:MAG: phosphate ABC transporter permease PstA [Comamonadaceae bacterium]|nr:phosphate ABC transporter permease PstA [Comamonadaceae bacterium]